jgi:hypothetical protein
MYYYIYEVKEGMGGSCSMNQKNDMCIQNFCRKTQKEVAIWQT